MRLFLALIPPRAIRQHLLAASYGLSGARWQTDSQLHVTMRYIGDTDRHHAEALMLALRQARLRAITARLDGIGHFERRGRVDQLWAGIAPREPLAALHARLDRLCVDIGLEPERRKYVPHITLARFARTSAPDASQLAAWLGAQPPLPGDSFVFDRLMLIESQLGAEGSAYEPLAELAMPC